ncbi:putative protein phosphatase 2C 66 [Nymphaea thermarum]|nr:putative protein phosphatase 2C 66 [Nymphaea thermarum]
MGTCLSTEGDSFPARSSSSASSKRRGRKNRGSFRKWSSSSKRRDAVGSSGGAGGTGPCTLFKGEDDLLDVPGRMYLNGSSEVSCLFTQQGRKGTNQDAMLVWENFASRSDTIFCGVFDGHGPFGHMVARKVRDSLPLKLCTHWKVNGTIQNSLSENNSATGSMNSEETASINMDDEWGESLPPDGNEKLPEMYLTLKQSFLKAFKVMDKELKLHPTIDCFCSGTTAVTLVKQGQDLVIGNVGDSRAILGTRDEDGTLCAVQLTVDLKPNLPREAERIQQCKGRVFALHDEPEVARVWLPNNDSPGLAMARAFGDFCLKDFGLISVPDVSYHHVTEKDEFVVLATDGVWDVLSNKEVVDIVASAPSRATAARALVECAVRAWRLKFPTSKSDDCAAICLFLQRTSSADQTDLRDLELNGPPAFAEISTAVEEVAISDLTEDDSDGKPNGPIAATEASQTLPILSGNSHIDDEIVPISESKEAMKQTERCSSRRSLAECILTADDEEWSALEGVTRVNSLLNLPRFFSGDKRSSSWRKWL